MLVAGLVLPLEAEEGVVAVLMEYAPVARDRRLVEADDLSTLETISGLAVDGLDGFALVEIALRIGLKKCLRGHPPISIRHNVTTRSSLGFQRFSKRHIGIGCDVLISPQTRGGLDL
jgi:hypothetical protein